MCRARIAGFLRFFAMCSLWLSAGPRAGRYGPKEQLCCWLVLLVTIHLALCFLLFRQARMLCIMAGVAQMGFFKFVDIPFVAQRQIPMVQTFLQTTVIPKLPFVFRWSMSLLCRSCLPYPLLSTTGAQVHCGFSAVAVHSGRRLPVATPRLVTMVLATKESPQLLFDLVVNAPIMQVVLVPGFQLPCRGAEASPWCVFGGFMAKAL